MKTGIAFVLFWTPFFAFIEYQFFHMNGEQIVIARSVAGVFNFLIGCKYHQIKRALGGAKGMIAIKLAVTACAYTTVIACGFAEFHFLKLVAKTLIATLLGFLAGKFGLFDLFFLAFDYLWVAIFGGKREVRTKVAVQKQEEEVEHL